MTVLSSDVRHGALHDDRIHDDLRDGRIRGALVYDDPQLPQLVGHDDNRRDDLRGAYRDVRDGLLSDDIYPFFVGFFIY
jgi:hypothetical protein